jgi:molecular chaperone DnaK (HSP70)
MNNSQPHWLARWGHKIAPVEFITESDRQLLAKKEAQKLAEKEVQERVDKALQAHAEYMPEETKQQIKAIIAETQAKIGLAPDSPKVSLVPKPLSRLKRLFLKKS